MPTKLIFEDGSALTAHKRLSKMAARLQAAYEKTGILSLPDGYYVKSIQGLPPEAKNKEPVTLILIARN
jgi:hypothetical protein